MNLDWVKALGPLASINEVDGKRMIFQSKDVIHFRPSGNAPEFRIYTESLDLQRLQAFSARCVEWVKAQKLN
jgi:phosphomannomutase